MLFISNYASRFQNTALEKEARSTLDKQQFTYRRPNLCATSSNTANAHAPVRSELAAFVCRASFILLVYL